MKRLKIQMPVRNRKLIKNFGKKAGPVLINELIWGCGFTMYSVIMGHMGTDAVAANSIANISKNLAVCLCLGLGSAGSIIVGNALGADRFEEAKKVGRTLTKLSVLCGIFPAGGDSKFGLLCDTVTLWCITVPLGCLGAFILEFPVLGVYFILNLDEIVKLPAVYRHYRKYGWVKNIT